MARSWKAGLLVGALASLGHSDQGVARFLLQPQIRDIGSASTCFGPNGICTIWTDMNDVCQKALGQSQNFTAWRMCLCESGWLTVNQAYVPEKRPL